MNIYKQRRIKLLENLKILNDKKSLILIPASFEQDCQSFDQDPNFFYFTGLDNPGLFLTVDFLGAEKIWHPEFKINRSNWVLEDNFDSADVKDFEVLGDAFDGYSFYPDFDLAEVKNLINYLKDFDKILIYYPAKIKHGVSVRFLFDRLSLLVPGLKEKLVDISYQIDRLRQVKDQHEIEAIYKAVEITAMAQEAAEMAIKSGATEAEVQAAIDYVFIASNAKPAFPSIVASGVNSTILHYTNNSAVLKKGDMVVVDIGAKYKNYCADITRTYCVDSKFNKRQQEIYDLVLETQEFVQNIARPGMWLSNSKKQDQSLNHLSREFLKEKGYDKYFLHGIGHYLGLDVHDVGDYSQPLQKGEVFTIEPGIYIREESLGVRIEDNYWVVEDSVVCLSEDIKK